MFIPTNSLDGTADALVSFAIEADVSCFRFNIDLWWKYEISVGPDAAFFRDPTGRHYDLVSDKAFVIWRKPFIDSAFRLSGLPEADDSFALSNLSWLLKYIAREGMRRGIMRLVEPYADSRLPKMLQLNLAQEYFEVPKWNFIQNSASTLDSDIITKPLGSPLVNEKVLYTTKVDPAALSTSFPWFLQESVRAAADITCLYIDGHSFFYECEFDRDKGSDWRVEINSPRQAKWRPTKNLDIEFYSRSVKELMSSFQLKFGRLDFLRVGDRLIFLEVNSNGEFGWLDNESLYLHKFFFDKALDESTSI